VAAAIGRSVNIPVIVRSLGHDLYRSGFNPKSGFKPGLDLIVFLDGDLCSFGLDHPSLSVKDFHVPWWQGKSPPVKYTAYLSFVTLRPALAHYRRQISQLPGEKESGSLSFLATPPELNKPAYIWHPEAEADLNNPCTRCRLYRAIPLGLWDKLKDLENYAHANEVCNSGEEAVAMRRASGFNALFEAVLTKETEPGSGPAPFSHGPVPLPGGSGLRGGKKGKGKEKMKVSVLSEEMRLRSYLLWKDTALWPESSQSGKEGEVEAGRPWTKWTWGESLNVEDLRNMVRGADRQYELPHSGYDEDLRTGKLSGVDSGHPDPTDFSSDAGVLWPRTSLKFVIFVRTNTPHAFFSPL